MKAHGAQLSLNGKQYRQFGTSDQTSSGHRNLFGNGAPDELYKGFVDEKNQQDRPSFSSESTGGPIRSSKAMRRQRQRWAGCS